MEMTITENRMMGGIGHMKKDREKNEKGDEEDEPNI